MSKTKQRPIALLSLLLILLVSVTGIGGAGPIQDPEPDSADQRAKPSREQAGKVVSGAGTQTTHRPDNMFPNVHDSGIDDPDPHIPATYFHLLSIPFNTSDRILRVYCEKPCFVDAVEGEWYGFGVQFLDRCHNDDIRLAVYDPSVGVSTYLGVIRERHGSNHGGIFMPLALTRDDRNIILQAWMGLPGAGGGLVDYGYAMMPVKAIPDDTTCPDVRIIATEGALFYDTYGKAIYLGGSDKMPRYPQPGPSHNSGALFFRNLISNEESIVLEEENTTYELEAVDMGERTITLIATEYKFNDTCPKDENGYYCAPKAATIRILPLP